MKCASSSASRTILCPLGCPRRLPRYTCLASLSASNFPKRGFSAGRWRAGHRVDRARRTWHHGRPRDHFGAGQESRGLGASKEPTMCIETFAWCRPGPHVTPPPSFFPPNTVELRISPPLGEPNKITTAEGETPCSSGSWILVAVSEHCRPSACQALSREASSSPPGPLAEHSAFPIAAFARSSRG